MYKFHSDQSKNKYNNKSQLLFRETDSLTYENVVATIGHNEYRDVLLISKCLRHQITRIQGKDHRIETYKINKISLPCFDDKIYIQNNEYDGLALGYQS